MVKAILGLLSLMLLAAGAAVLGAIHIRDAIENFRKKRYFMFGIDIMIAILFAASVVKLVVVNLW